jgi:hypothetical protein
VTFFFLALLFFLVLRSLFRCDTVVIPFQTTAAAASLRAARSPSPRLGRNVTTGAAEPSAPLTSLSYIPLAKAYRVSEGGSLVGGQLPVDPCTGDHQSSARSRSPDVTGRSFSVLVFPPLITFLLSSHSHHWHTLTHLSRSPYSDNPLPRVAPWPPAHSVP